MSGMLGLAAFEGAMARIAAVFVESHEVNHHAAELVAEDMRSNVAVQSGETQASIQVTDVDGGDAVITSAGASIYLEFGTINMAAEPFARPAIDDASRHEGELADVARGLLLGAL